MDPSSYGYTNHVLSIWKDRQILDSRTFKNLADELKGQSGRLWEVYNTKFVQEIYDLIGETAKQGLTYRDFKEQANEILAKYGNVSVMSGGIFSSSYADIVIRTNTQQMYAAGKYSTMFRSDRMKAVPYLLYNAIDDSLTRPSHAALDGKVFRKDDLTARTILPPNGFGCRCSVIELDEEEVKEGGYTITGGNQVIGQTVTKDDVTYTIGPDRGWDADRVTALVPQALKGNY